MYIRQIGVVIGLSVRILTTLANLKKEALDYKDESVLIEHNLLFIYDSPHFFLASCQHGYVFPPFPYAETRELKHYYTNHSS